MMNKIESIGNTTTGKIIYSSDDCQDILRLPVTEIIDVFKPSGVIIFRGFGVTHEQMKEFAAIFSSKFIQDYKRPQVDSDKFIHFVDAGMDNCVPHSEHAYSPFRPDAIWFCCAFPAAEGGETTFCDGIRVWEELSEETRQLFISKKLKFYYEDIPVVVLKRLASTDAASTDDLKRMLDGLEGVKYQIKEDESVSMEYVNSAVVKTKYGNQDAFANSVLALHAIMEKVAFEDGSIVPDEVIEEIEKTTDRLMEHISWQAGDLAMIDNSRFMHGRREFNDQRRQIFSTLSNLKF